MHHFQYRNNELYCEDVPVKAIAEDVGTPFYLYSHATLKQHFRAFDGAFSDIKHLTCFSMKSNSNSAILRLFANEGGGVDIVSGGELFRALKAGIHPGKVVYSGVGKRIEDLYAVCGQAQKSIHWMEKPTELFTHMLRRDPKNQKGLTVGRFEKGNRKGLSKIREMSRTLPMNLGIFIVQPGLSKKEVTLDQRELLSVTENYLMETYKLHFGVIASP